MTLFFWGGGHTLTPLTYFRGQYPQLQDICPWQRCQAKSSQAMFAVLQRPSKDRRRNTDVLDPIDKVVGVVLPPLPLSLSYDWQISDVAVCVCVCVCVCVWVCAVVMESAINPSARTVRIVETLYAINVIAVRFLDSNCSIRQVCSGRPRIVENLMHILRSEYKVRISYTSTVKLPYTYKNTWHLLYRFA